MNGCQIADPYVAPPVSYQSSRACAQASSNARASVSAKSCRNRFSESRVLAAKKSFGSVLSRISATPDATENYVVVEKKFRKKISKEWSFEDLLLFNFKSFFLILNKNEADKSLCCWAYFDNLDFRGFVSFEWFEFFGQNWRRCLRWKLSENFI